MKVYLVRHPQTKRNINNKLTGWENTHYTELGRQQFKDIVEFFKMKKFPIFSSDLSRAKRLAEAISKKNKMKISFSKNLREMNFKETKPHDSSEDRDEFAKRIEGFLKKHSVEGKIIVCHVGTINEIKKLLKDEIIEESKPVKRVTKLILKNKKAKDKKEDIVVK